MCFSRLQLWLSFSNRYARTHARSHLHTPQSEPCHRNCKGRNHHPVTLRQIRDVPSFSTKQNCALQREQGKSFRRAYLRPLSVYPCTYGCCCSHDFNKRRQCFLASSASSQGRSSCGLTTFGQDMLVWPLLQYIHEALYCWI